MVWSQHTSMSLCATRAITSVHSETSTNAIPIAFISSTNALNTLATFRNFSHPLNPMFPYIPTKKQSFGRSQQRTRQPVLFLVLFRINLVAAMTMCLRLFLRSKSALSIWNKVPCNVFGILVIMLTRKDYDSFCFHAETWLIMWWAWIRGKKSNWEYTSLRLLNEHYEERISIMLFREKAVCNKCLPRANLIY